ncbi:hypothetical protein [Sporolactobacillus laevolacticus]|uniref:Uncharacterized protein n=1 Tax=Sporolactobacillus laevolacticus DSM 442 TaxID=1395513 RepID=V6J1K5_9BACL|nr:hypothetical protein [Sporolactobacillus laevolacticus]EST10649.1 hypothetical protein P343_16045 [Sporolactobacillus laevolacticus DSM 442]
MQIIKNALKVIFLSILHAVCLFIVTFPMFRPYQIASWFHISEQSLEHLYFAIVIIGALLYFFVVVKLTSSLFKGSLLVLLSALLWFPFWLLLTYYSTWIPNNNPNDGDNYGAAFFLLLLLFVYPIFIGFSCAIGMSLDHHQNRDS